MTRLSTSVRSALRTSRHVPALISGATFAGELDTRTRSGPFRLRGGTRRDLLARADVVTVPAGIGRDRILSSFDVLVDRFARLAGESSATLGCEHMRWPSATGSNGAGAADGS